MPKLFDPLTIRGVTFRNRVAVSPMCQYCAADGLADDWHLVHLGSRAAGGAGLVIVEASAVTPDGRITLGDMGIWSDTHAERLGRIVRFLKSQHAVPGIQLAHAGRKASCAVPQDGGKQLALDHGGWQTVGPSPVPFREGDRTPTELDLAGIRAVTAAFVAAAERSLAAGFEVLELHAAHGYLLHSFLSPLANERGDDYGGSFDNRVRFLLETAAAVRAVMPERNPLFVRVSATDWLPGGWDADQSVELARRLKPLGVDLMDVSSGAILPHADIPNAPGYQVPFARRIKHEAGMLTGAVGLITEPSHAAAVIAADDADLVLLGRELLRDPYWPLHAAEQSHAEASWPRQYGYAVGRRK